MKKPEKMRKPDGSLTEEAQAWLDYWKQQGQKRFSLFWLVVAVIFLAFIFWLILSPPPAPQPEQANTPSVEWLGHQDDEFDREWERAKEETEYYRRQAEEEERRLAEGRPWDGNDDEENTP